MTATIARSGPNRIRYEEDIVGEMDTESGKERPDVLGQSFEELSVDPGEPLNPHTDPVIQPTGIVCQHVIATSPPAQSSVLLGYNHKAADQDHEFQATSKPVEIDSINTRTGAEILAEQNARRAKEREDESRRAIITLGETEIREMLHLPESMDVVVIFADPARRGIEIVVRDDSFAPLAPGCMAPNVEGTWRHDVKVDPGDPTKLYHRHAFTWTLDA